jgi:hypothetical protein
MTSPLTLSDRAEMLKSGTKLKTEYVENQYSRKVSDKIALIRNQLRSKYFNSDHTHKWLVSKLSIFT